MQLVCACELLVYSGNSLLHHSIRIAAALPHSLPSFSYKYTASIPIAVVNTICFFQFQTAFIHITMASFLTWLGRFAFFGLITTQCMFLSAYLEKYEGESNWYLATIFFGPAVLFGFFFYFSKRCTLATSFEFGVCILWLWL